MGCIARHTARGSCLAPVLLFVAAIALFCLTLYTSLTQCACLSSQGGDVLT